MTGANGGIGVASRLLNSHRGVVGGIERAARPVIRGDGTADSPKGFRTFVPNANVIPSADAFSLTTVTSELGGAVVRLTQANVPMLKPIWIMHPRTLEYIWWVQNANGVYVCRPGR